MEQIPEYIADYPDRKILESIRKRLYNAGTWSAPELWSGHVGSALGEIEHFCPEGKVITVASDREVILSIQPKLVAFDGQAGTMQDILDELDAHLESKPDEPPTPKKSFFDRWPRVKRFFTRSAVG